MQAMPNAPESQAASATRDDWRERAVRFVKGRSLAQCVEVLFAIAVPIILAIATASWLLVEKPVLRLKDWRWRRALVLRPA